MIEINLLPEEMRKEKRIQFVKDLTTSKFQLMACGSVAGILIVLVILLSIGSAVRKFQTVLLLKKEQAMGLEKSKIEAVNNEISILNAKMTALDGLTKRRFLWAEKINQLSDLILPGTWFTRIYTASEGALMIEGSVISKREEAMVTVGNFMKDVRENESFFKDFANIKLESVQRKSFEEKDIVDFKIVLYFK